MILTVTFIIQMQLKKITKKFNWYVPKTMRPGKIFIMDSITPHNSNSVSTTPRLAINVKIQPRSLNYIYKIFGLTKAFKSNLKILILKF